MDSVHSRAAIGSTIGDALAFCESELSTDTGGPVVEFYQRRGARSDRSAIPACAAHALKAAQVFTSVDAAFEALLAADNHLSPEDRANCAGFTIAAVQLVISARTTVTVLQGSLARRNVGALLQSGRPLILHVSSCGGHFLTFLPDTSQFPARSWIVRDSRDDATDHLEVDYLPVDTQAVLVVGASRVGGLK